MGTGGSFERQRSKIWNFLSPSFIIQLTLRSWSSRKNFSSLLIAHLHVARSCNAAQRRVVSFVPWEMRSRVRNCLVLRRKNVRHRDRNQMLIDKIIQISTIRKKHIFNSHENWVWLNITFPLVLLVTSVSNNNEA